MSLSSPGQSLRATQAVCAVLKPRELLLGRAPGGRADAQWHAAASGAMAQGVRVLDAGECTLPQLRHAVQALRCDGGILVEARRLTPLNALGAHLPNRQQRAVAGQNARQDFTPPFQREAPPIEPTGGLHAAYVAEAAARFTAEAKAAPPVALYAPDPPAADLAAQAFQRCRSVRTRRGRPRRDGARPRRGGRMPVGRTASGARFPTTVARSARAISSC